MAMIMQPYGNAFLVGTPKLDELHHRIVEDQKNRELQKQKEQKDLDEEFAKNLSNIRDIDISDLTKAYGNFKLASQQLMKQKNATPEQQLDVLRKKADVYNIISKSKEFRNNVENPIREGLSKDKNKYVDNAGDMIKESINTPILKMGLSKLYKDKDGNFIDLANPASYNYVPVTDFSKEMTAAFGSTPRDLGEFDESVKGAANKTLAKYKGFNSPFQAYNNLLESLTDPRRANDFIKTHHFSPAEEQAIVDKYNSIVSDPVYQKLYNLKGDEVFRGDNTELGKAAKIAIMMGVTKPSRDISMPINQENAQQFQIAQQNRAHRNRMGEIEFSHNLKQLEDRYPVILPDNITEAVKSGDINKIKEALAPLAGGNKNYIYNDVKIVPNNLFTRLNGTAGNVVVNVDRKVFNNKTGDYDKHNEQIVLDPKDKKLYPQAAKLVQQHFGENKEIENRLLKNKLGDKSDHMNRKGAKTISSSKKVIKGF